MKGCRSRLPHPLFYLRHLLPGHRCRLLPRLPLPRRSHCRGRRHHRGSNVCFSGDSGKLRPCDVGRQVVEVYPRFDDSLVAVAIGLGEGGRMGQEEFEVGGEVGGGEVGGGTAYGGVGREKGGVVRLDEDDTSLWR